MHSHTTAYSGWCLSKAVSALASRSARQGFRPAASMWLVLYIGVMSWAWFLERRHPMEFEEDDEATP